MSSKMYRCIKCSLRAPKIRKKWYSTRSLLHRKSASFTDYLGNYVPLYSCNTSRDRHRKKYLIYSRMFSCNLPHSKYKNKNRKSNCMNYKLSNDKEKNPGPFMFNIDPSKTIQAPYSQGDALTDVVTEKITYLKSHGSKCHSKEHSDRKSHPQKSLPKIIVAKTVMRKTTWNKMCIKICFRKICAKKKHD